MRCLLTVLAIVAAVNADVDQPCSKQMELEKRCMLTIETSPETTMIRDRKKQVMKTCVPDMPQECHAEWEAAHECATSIQKNADTDALFTESKSKSGPAIDECFTKYPPNVKEGFNEIFMMGKPHPPPGFHRRHRHHRHNDTESGENNESGENASAESAESGSNSNETDSFERRHHGGGGGGGGGGRGGGGRHHHGGGGGGGGGRGGRGGHGRHCHHGGRGGRGGHGGHGGRGGGGHHHRPRNFTSSEESNNSSSESGSSESGGRSGSHSGSHERKRMPEQCRKTPEQWKCIKDEFKKLGEDTSFLNIMNTLIRQKKKCKQIVDWTCSAKCPKRQRCIFKATRPCREAFMTRMKTCMQDKGFTLPPFMQHMQGTDAFTTPMPDMQP